MKIRRYRRGTLALLAALATIAAPPAVFGGGENIAHAQERAEQGRAAGEPVIGLDMEKATLVASSSLVSDGSGFAGRVGYLLHVPFIRLTPEIGYGYLHFNQDRASDDWATHRLFVGARAGLGELLVPSAFGHVGYALISTSDGSSSHHASFLDFGVALDLHLIPHLGVGVHAAYETIRSAPHPVAWLSLGVHGEVVF